MSNKTYSNNLGLVRVNIWNFKSNKSLDFTGSDHHRMFQHQLTLKKFFSQYLIAFMLPKKYEKDIFCTDYKTLNTNSCKSYFVA